MLRLSNKALLSVSLVGLTAGCSAIDLSQITPIGPSIASCKSATGGATSPAAAAAVASRSLDFSKLVANYAGHDAAAGGPLFAAGAASPVGFDEFARQADARRGALPANLRDDVVVRTVFQLIIRSTAVSQANEQESAGAAVAKSDMAKITNYGGQTSLARSDVKAFTRKMITYGMLPRLDTSGGGGLVAGATAPSSSPNTFSTYFQAYYSNKYVDRLGQSISLPPISLTVSDSEIASALTVLIDYVADLVDPTPVMGSGPLGSSGLLYYPGANSSEPTVLAAGLAKYVVIPEYAACDWNQQDAPVLGYLATAAGDQAGTITGITTKSFGGIEVGFGVLGKLSIGDNQTLSTIVKTAASRLAMRATLAGTYWALESADHSGTPPVTPKLAALTPAAVALAPAAIGTDSAAGAKIRSALVGYSQ
jgi:hypothetical protein